MATVVVCDDDKVVRAAISAVCADAGLEVVAETDSGADCAEMVRRFAVDVLVLDLSLSDGSGELTLENLNREGSNAAVIIFTAYASDPGRLIRLGAREVVDKPDFALLGDVLKALGTSVDHAAAAPQPDDRRLASRDVETAPKMWRSPAGVSSRHDLAHSLLQLELGDAALAVTVAGLDALENDVGAAAHQRLPPGRGAASCVSSCACRTSSTRLPRSWGSWRCSAGATLARRERCGLASPWPCGRPPCQARSRGPPAGSTTSAARTPWRAAVGALQSVDISLAGLRQRLAASRSAQKRTMCSVSGSAASHGTK